jgi:hypothetical protein
LYASRPDSQTISRKRRAAKNASRWAATGFICAFA